MEPEYQVLKQGIVALLQAGHALTVRWDCGGDQSIVTTEVDGQEADTDYNDPHNLPVLLDRYLTDLLQLPDVGDFAMQGSGRIFLDATSVVIEYQSDYTDYTDPNEYGLSDEEWRAMGMEPPARPAADEAPATPANAETASPAATTFDQDMSDEYSGRRVLFTLP
ncbi:MAG: hypothetical protein ACRYFX_01965 [Janthinobacterium lividum]